MAPKKKLTAEEKKKLLAEKKLQKKLAAEEAKRQIKRDHLARELKYGELNRAKLEKGWRDMLLSITLPKMRTDVEVYMNLFERTLDLKDCQINMLKTELDEAEEQYQINFRGHCEQMEKILDIYHDTLDELKEDYDKCLKEILETALDKRRDTEFKKKADEEHLNLILLKLDNQNNYVNRIVRGDYISKYDGEVKQSFDTLQIIRAVEERKFENMWEQYENTLKEYINEIQDRVGEYNKLHAIDKEMRYEIKDQNISIFESHDLIRKLKLKERIEKLDIEDSLRYLIKEKKHFEGTFNTLKQKLQKDSDNDKQQIDLLTAESNNTISYLQKLCKLTENILRWKLLCQKFETQDDDLEINSDDTEGDLNKQVEALTDQIAKVKIQKLKLLTKKEILLKENNVLKKKMQRYCEEASCACKYLNKNQNNKPVADIVMNL